MVKYAKKCSLCKKDTCVNNNTIMAFPAGSVNLTSDYDITFVGKNAPHFAKYMYQVFLYCSKLDI